MVTLKAVKVVTCKFLSLFFLTVSNAIVLSLNDPTSNFAEIPNSNDPSFDGPNNVESSLVGDGTSGLSSSYIGFDPGVVGNSTDGTLFLRLRVSGDVDSGNNDLGEFNEFALFGFDVTGDAVLDFFIEVDGSSNAFDPVVMAVDATGGVNNSILTIGPGSSLNGVNLNASIDFSLVSDIDGLSGSDADLDSDGGIDALLTVSVDFSAIAAAANTTGASGFNDTSSFAIIALLDPNGSFNGSNGVGDIAGVDDDNPGTGLFADTGGLSNQIDSSGNEVPEARAYAMILGLFVFFSVIFRRRSRPLLSL